MKRILLLLVMAAIAVVDISAQHEVRITTKDGTTEIPLDEISSISVGDELWGKWEQIGTGTFNLSIYWVGPHSELPIYYRTHLQNDIDAQFFIPGIAGQMDLTIEYNRQTGACQVLPQYALTNPNYGQVTVSDIPHYPFTNLSGTYEEYPCYYDAEKGLISLNLVYFVSTDYNANTNGTFGNGVETFQLDGFKQYDYSFSMVFNGTYTKQEENKEYAVFNIVKGADISKYLFRVVEYGSDLDATIAGMADGTINCAELTESTVLHYPIEKSGKYVALAITYDEEGNVHSEYSTNFEFYLTDENPWVSLGYAEYTDDIILPLYGNSPMSYYVEVLENKDQPGIFRLVDLCGPEYPFYTYGTYEEGNYIEIDATDPTAVWIAGWQNTGFDLGQGVIKFTSMAWYQANAEGATKEDVAAAGLCGVYADGVITFPTDGIVVGIGEKAYYANRNGAFKLDMTNMIESLPEESTAAKAPAMRFEGGRKLSIGNNAKRVLRTVEAKKSKSIPAGIKSTEDFDPTIIEE